MYTVVKNISLNDRKILIDGVAVPGCDRVTVYHGERSGYRVVLDLDAEEFFHGDRKQQDFDTMSIDIPSGSVCTTSSIDASLLSGAIDTTLLDGIGGKTHLC